VAEQPIVLRKGIGVAAYASEMMTGPITVEKNLLRPGLTSAGAQHNFPDIVSNTPEGIFKYIISEELLHLIRGATPGKVRIRENVSNKQFKSAPVPGRKFAEYPHTPGTTSGLQYYTQNPQELAAGTALGYIPTRTKKRPEFADFLLPTEETFKRYGYKSAEDFWQQANSPAFRQAPLRLKQARRAVEHAAERAAAPKPQVLRPAGAKNAPLMMPFMDWLREYGKNF
jgi:hypothetical protein